MIWAQLTESFVLSLFKVGVPSLEADMQQFDQNRKVNPKLDPLLFLLSLLTHELRSSVDIVSCHYIIPFRVFQ